MKNFLRSFFIFSVVICFVSINGCSKSEDGVTPNNPTSSGNLGTLSINPNSIIVNTSTQATIKLTVPTGTTLSDTTVKLYKVDASGNQGAQLGILLDNGLLANGDDIKGDNVFTGVVNLNESAAGDLRLKAVGQVNSTTTSNSDISVVTVYADLASNSMSVLYAVQNAARAQMQTYLAGSINNLDNAVTQLKAWLLTQPGVASVETEGSTSLMITYSSGLNGGLIFAKTDASGNITTRGGSEINDDRGRTPQIPIDQQTRGINDHVPGVHSSNLDFDPNTVGNRNVLIYAPFEAAFAPYNERQTIIDRLNASSCKGFSITSYVNQAANISVLNNLTQYGYIVLATHGSQGKAFSTGEVVDTTLASYASTYKPMLIAGKLAVWNHMKISITGGVTTYANVYAIRYPFISSLSGTFPNSIILNNSCESTMNAFLNNAFTGKGAKAYFGYSKVVNSNFAVTMADTLTKRLAAGKNVQQAFYSATDPTAPNAVYQGFSSNPNLMFSISLVNGDFEEGNISGWTKDGDGRVITRLGGQNPTQGSYMGIISTGLGFTVSAGSISQCLTVSNTQTTLTFKWNFLSEEFLEYINSQFQDYFVVSVTKSDGTTIELFRKKIDDIAAMFGATPQSPGSLISVSPGIVFDRGGVYMTGWQSASFNISAYQGQTITVKLSAGDVGDSIYDTAILLDEIAVN